MTKQEFWKRCDPEMREFLKDCLELQEIIKAFDGTVSSQGPEGVLVFPEREWESKGYWS